MGVDFRYVVHIRWRVDFRYVVLMYILDDGWIPSVSAYCFASSVLTTFFETRSHLLPTSILFTFSFAYLHELSAVSATKYDSGNVIKSECQPCC